MTSLKFLLLILVTIFLSGCSTLSAEAEAPAECQKLKDEKLQLFYAYLNKDDVRLAFLTDYFKKAILSYAPQLIVSKGKETMRLAGKAHEDAVLACSKERGRTACHSASEALEVNMVATRKLKTQFKALNCPGKFK